MKKRAVLWVALGGGGLLLLRETVAWVVTKALDALAASFAQPLTLENFPWLNALGVVMILVAALGLISDRTGEQRNDCTYLYERMKALYSRLDTCVSGSINETYPDIMGEVVAVFMSLENLGIVTPVVSGSNARELYRISRIYVGALMPMIRDGHIANAKKEAPRVIENNNGKIATLPKRLLPFLPFKTWNAALDSPTGDASR